jgi:bacillithiol biosynthesis deacetylase BshB1
MKLDLLAFGAHPDDVELGAGGSIAREVANGRKVGIVDLTRGELGTRGSADIRDAESAASASLLGVELRMNMEFKDGFFSDDASHQLALIPVIRYLKPDVVICNSNSDRHPDHGKAARLVSKACFLAGLPRIPSQWDGEEQLAWRPSAVYHYIQDRYLKPDFVIDISDFIELKMKSVLAFRTQFFDPDSIEPETPISGKAFLEFLHARAIDFGRPAGFHYAEGFQVERYPGVDTFFHLR